MLSKHFVVSHHDSQRFVLVVTFAQSQCTCCMMHDGVAVIGVDLNNVMRSCVTAEFMRVPYAWSNLIKLRMSCAGNEIMPLACI